MCLQFSDFQYFCAKTIFIVRFLGIHPVQSVINNATQLSGRGFPYIFYMKLVLSQLYVFSVLQNGSRAAHFEANKNMNNFEKKEILKFVNLN